MADALHDNPDIIDNILADLTEIKNNYIPRSGGTTHPMTGPLIVPATWELTDTGNQSFIMGTSNGNSYLGRNTGTTYVRSNATDLFHTKNGTNYKIWDASNLNPATVADLANYLKLSGGTMTGHIILKNGVVLYGQLVNGSDVHIASLNNNNNLQLGSISATTIINSKGVDLIHYRDSKQYKIWDAYNLPNPASVGDIPDLTPYAKKAGDNAFTGTNSFVGGKFSVEAPSGETVYINNGGNIYTNITGTGGWERHIAWIHNNVAASKIIFGAYGNGDAMNYAYLALGGTNYQTAQYKFKTTQLDVPVTWSLADANGDGLIVAKSGELSFGRTTNTTHIRSAAGKDLYHNKGGTNYVILDASNYMDYLEPLPEGVAMENWVTSNFYPLAGKGCLSFDGLGRPVMAYNQGYAAKNKGGTIKEILWTVSNNGIVLGMTDNSAVVHIAGTTLFNRYSGETYTTQEWVQKQGYLTSKDLSSYATQSWTNTQLSKYLPLTGGTVTGQTLFDGTSGNMLVLDSNATNETFIQVRRSGADKAAIGYYDGMGAYLYGYDVTKYLFLKSTGVFYGTKSANQKLLTSADLGGYATQAWVKSQKYLTDGDLPDLSGYATQSWVNSQGFLKSSALSGYATQSWVEGKGYATKGDVTNALSGYVKSTSTLKVSDIRVLAAGSTPGSTTGVLYIVLEA